LKRPAGIETLAVEVLHFMVSKKWPVSVIKPFVTQVTCHHTNFKGQVKVIVQ